MRMSQHIRGFSNVPHWYLLNAYSIRFSAISTRIAIVSNLQLET